MQQISDNKHFQRISRCFATTCTRLYDLIHHFQLKNIAIIGVNGGLYQKMGLDDVLPTKMNVQGTDQNV